MKNTILIKNGLIEVPVKKNKLSNEILGTLLSNISYYGYILSKDALAKLQSLSDKDAKSWWQDIEPTLKSITGDDKNMGEYVVYKNFPAEALKKSEAEYWIAQILMYWGLPNELFTETEQKRDLMLEKLKLKVLQLSAENSLVKIYNSLVALPNKFTKEQLSHVLFIYQTEEVILDSTQIPFKENLIILITELIGLDAKIKLSSAMDVLRLAIGLSGGDVSLKEKSKFKSFSRKQRRFFLNLLENTSNLEEDVARDKEKWNKFLHHLHPNDFNYIKVSAVFDKLYNNNVESFNSKVELLLKNKDSKVLGLLKSRPGDFTRRLHKTLDVFGKSAADAYVDCLGKLNTIQLLKIQKYINTINDRKHLTIAPKGNWTKLQILDNKKRIGEILKSKLDKNINQELGNRLSKYFKAGVNLDKSANLIKLQTNDAELASYGRGTSFPIPADVKFIRTASYWKQKGTFGSTWFDNGWNFFDSNWKSLGSCCWTNTNFGNGASVFSGDPTNSKTVDGKACQMIDLYPDKLVQQGVRFAIWNVLCYSRIKFKDAEDVFAALQWGEEAQKGKLFEPSRCQLAFPLKGDTFTKYVAYLDLQENKLIYIDANLKCSTNSANSNNKTLEEKMPAFVEYLNTLPSVYDLFVNAGKSKTGINVSFSDEKLDIKNKKAYIFQQVNQNNKFEQLDISKLLKV